MRLCAALVAIAFISSVAGAVEDMSVGNMFTCWNLRDHVLKTDKALLCRPNDEVAAWIFASCAKDEEEMIQRLGTNDDGEVEEKMIVEGEKIVAAMKKLKAEGLEKEYKDARAKLCTE